MNSSNTTEQTTTDLQTAVKTQYSNKKMFLTAVIGIGIYVAFYLLWKTHTPDTPWGWKSVLPTAVVVITAILSRRPFESLLAGGIAGLVMLDPMNLISPFADNLSKVMGDPTIVWIILVTCLTGGFIHLLEVSGCLGGFTEWLKRYVKSRRQSQVATVGLGVLIFFDDYLNCLAVSSSVKKLTDYYKVSREKVAYLVDSTAAPMCILVPISVWAVFFVGLIEENGLVEKNQGMSLYISSIPYMIYPLVALTIAILVATGVLGNWGPMKRAETRAQNGQPVPPDFAGQELESKDMARRELSMNRKLLNFFIPLIVLVTATIYFQVNLLNGLLVACPTMILMYYLQGILTFEEQSKALFDGFYTMMYPLSTLVGGFFLKEINDALGMTEYVINTITPFLSKETLPAIAFLVLSLLAFATASFWGVFIVAMPIIVPIAITFGVDPMLLVGMLLSAAAFGSHACFFGDSSILAAQGAGCSPMAHAFTQFPYALLGAVIAASAFWVLGHQL